MNTTIVCWWHRAWPLRHVQEPVMNGATEPGVWCYCEGYAEYHLSYGVVPVKRRWFPSDGGRGR